MKIQLKEDETDVRLREVRPEDGGQVWPLWKVSGLPRLSGVQEREEDCQRHRAECPKCGGKIIQRKSKNGRVFYGCSEYPKCDFVSWDPPSKKSALSAARP